MLPQSVSVYGAGSWGTALAILLCNNIPKVKLWGRDAEAIGRIQEAGENKQYLPGVAYFSLLLSSDAIVIDRYEHYVRQTYRNRAAILGSNGPIDLTIPVLRGRRKQVFSE